MNKKGIVLSILAVFIIAGIAGAANAEKLDADDGFFYLDLSGTRNETVNETENETEDDGNETLPDDGNETGEDGDDGNETLPDDGNETIGDGDDGNETIPDDGNETGEDGEDGFDGNDTEPADGEDGTDGNETEDGDDGLNANGTEDGEDGTDGNDTEPADGEDGGDGGEVVEGTILGPFFTADEELIVGGDVTVETGETRAVYTAVTDEFGMATFAEVIPEGNYDLTVEVEGEVVVETVMEMDSIGIPTFDGEVLPPASEFTLEEIDTGSFIEELEDEEDDSPGFELAFVALGAMCVLFVLRKFRN